MKFALLLLLCALLLSAFIISRIEQEDSFTTYKNKFSKRYEDNDVEQYRRIIFYENLARIERHNA